MKKIISFVLALGLVISTIPGIYAEEGMADNYADYVPAEELPVNLLDVDQTASRTFTNRVVRNSTAVNGVKGTVWCEEAKCFAPQGLAALSDISKLTYQGYAGLVYKNYKFDKEKTYVFSVDVKADAGENVRVGVALTNEKANTISYSEEYGYDGMALTDEYQKLAVTLVPAAGFENDAETHSLVVGFPEGVKKDSVISMDTTIPDGIYLGEETVWDITNTVLTEENNICQDSVIKVKAEVVNQVGCAGTMEQNFTWKAMNKDKTEEVEGFSFVNNSDGTTNVKIAEDVEMTEYALVAVSDDYEGFIKTAYINVLGKKIQDTETENAAYPENLILQPTDKNFSEKTDSSVIKTENGNGFTTVTALTDIENNKNMKMDGIKIRTALNKGFASDFRFVPEKAYVVSVKVRKSATSTEEDVKFAVAFGQGTEETFTTTEIYGINGMTLTDEWQEFKDIIVISKDYNPEESARLFYLGMPDGTASGAAFDIELSAYIAEEVLSDVGIEIVDGNTDMTVDDETEFKMNMSNQLGITGSFAGDVKWFVLDENRNTVVEDVMVASDGNVARVMVDEFTPKGRYYIVAESETDDLFIRKSAEFTVDTLPIAEFVVGFLKTAEKETLSNKIKSYVKALDINFVESFNKDIVAEIILNSMPEKLNEETVKKLIKKAIAVSLYAENSESVELYNKKGEFIYNDEISMSDMDVDGITVSEIFEEILSEDGKIEVQKELTGKNYRAISDFEKAFAKNVILKSIEKPGVSGSGYINEILTEKNAEYIDLDIEKYFSMKSKTQINKALARKAFTKSALEEVIAEFKSSTQGGNGSSGGGTTVKPAEKGVDVAATPQKQPEDIKKEIIFADVDENHWAYADIYHLKARNIINGVDDENFNPDGIVTREQFVKMLCIALEYETSAGVNRYADVVNGEWYESYINTALEKNIVNGIAGDLFGIGQPIKRQDLCVMVYRALGVEEESDMLSFSDKDKISDYAKNAVAYLNTYDIIKGFEDNTFRPDEYCTRAQAAKILCTILNMEGAIK